MDRLIIQRHALKVREKLGVDDNSPIDLVTLIGTCSDITLVFYPFNEEISGLCIKSVNLIAINSNSTMGRQAFSIAHELYHYFFDDNISSISYTTGYDNLKIEKEANLFASYLLMPDSTFSRFCNKLTKDGTSKIKLQDILEIEQYFKVSRNAVLIRLIQEKFITNEESELFKKDIIKNAKKYGFDTTLYLPSRVETPKTYGAYLKNAFKLKELGLISEAKYEEYLLDAYRSDIVFNDNGQEDIYD